MKNLHIILALLSIYLLLPIHAADKASSLEIMETAHRHMHANEKVLSIEELQEDGQTFAYFLKLGLKEGEEKENGIIISTSLEVIDSVSADKIVPFQYSPPRVTQVTHREKNWFHMPIKEPDSANYHMLVSTPKDSSIYK